MFTKDSRRPDKLNPCCRLCTREQGKASRERNPDTAKVNGKRWYESNKARKLAKNKEWRENNPEKMREYCKKWRDSDPEAAREYMREWDAKNRDKRKAYYNRNRAAALAKWARREALKIQATPKWANHSIINAMYALSDLHTERTGIRHNVDHIVPLRHPLVCGLHCEQNLRIITETANKSKGNRHWPDMPE